MAKQVKPRAGTNGERNGKAHTPPGPSRRGTPEAPAKGSVSRRTGVRTRFKPAIRVTDRVDVLELIGRGPDVDPAEESGTR